MPDYECPNCGPTDAKAVHDTDENGRRNDTYRCTTCGAECSPRWEVEV